MRLDKYVAGATSLTRSQVRKLIASGQVTVNSIIEKSSKLNLPTNANISISGKSIALPSKQYILLNKPKGYLCSTNNEHYPSALNLLEESNLSVFPNGSLRENKLQVVNQLKLHFAGRLDVDTTGLVLISDDGQWTHRITSPKHLHTKVYLVELADKLSDTSLETLSSGVLLKDSDKLTAAAQVEVVNDLKIRLTITEGRYHQVKRMIAAVGSHVISLHRESIGAVMIDDSVSLGNWRYLTDEEIKRF